MYHPILKTNKKVLCVLYMKTKRKPNKLFPFFLKNGNHGTNAFIRKWFAEDGRYKYLKQKTKKNVRHYFLPPPPPLPWPNRKKVRIKIYTDAVPLFLVSRFALMQPKWLAGCEYHPVSVFRKTKPTLFFTAFLHDWRFASPHTFSLYRKKCFHR